VTGTTPANTTGIYLLLDVGSPGIDTLYTALLYEQVGTAEDYFDGDSSGAAWDGADGNSTSQI
jgi:hypothetical protein